MLRSIPKEYIDAARNNLHIAYTHTSHGSHVTYGLFGLPHYKKGDDLLFGITDKAKSPVANKLDFHDYFFGGMVEDGLPDLSNADYDWDRFVDENRRYLDNSANSRINVVMWSWRSISDHNVSNYLTSMQTLIDEYSIGGTKIGEGSGKRKNPVTFILMTGHAEGDNVGKGKPKNQADLIVNYCNKQHLYCLDYYSIESHDLDGNYYKDATDNSYSAKAKTNYFASWQEAHAKGDG